MEEDMAVELVSGAREIDPVYEFDAAMFFDFTREESPEEARAAELWFASAQSYLPSPFAAKLALSEERFLDNGAIYADENENATVAASMSGDSSDTKSTEISEIEMDVGEREELYRGIYSNSQGGDQEEVPDQPRDCATGSIATLFDKSQAKVNSAVKLNLPRSSTLMKPTASVLAKQNRPLDAGSSRFQVLWPQKERSLCNSSVLLEIHAVKRQKLEGGHLHKVGHAKLQTHFIHKAPKKDENADKRSTYAKSRLTIPKEPGFVTAQRAQRMRSKSNAEQEQVSAAAQNFKARPLNRKILKGPTWPLPKKSTPKLPEFQEFHLRTLERAIKHLSGVSSSSFHCNDSNKGPDNVIVAENRKEPRRQSTMEASKQGGHGTMHLFKARPLNKKILSSKGDIGVFRNSKKETTVPMEFNLHTEKRNQQDPPIELFSKLSLTSELQPNSVSQLQVPQPSSVSLKGSKENILNTLQTKHKEIHLMQERPSMHAAQQVQCGSKGYTNEVGNQTSRRSLGIR